MCIPGNGTPFDAIVAWLKRLCWRDGHGLAVIGTRDAGVDLHRPMIRYFRHACHDRLAAENCDTSVSENYRSLVVGAITCDLSAGVEDTSDGCANAAVANRPAAIGVTSLMMRCEQIIVLAGARPNPCSIRSSGVYTPWQSAGPAPCLALREPSPLNQRSVLGDAAPWSVYGLLLFCKQSVFWP